MDPIKSLSLFRPLPQVDNVGAVGAGGRAAGPKGVNPFAGAEAGGIGAINREVTPTYDEQGSSYTSGLGHSKHTKMLWA